MLMDVMTKKCAIRWSAQKSACKRVAGIAATAKSAACTPPACPVQLGATCCPCLSTTALQTAPKSLHKIAVECVDFELHMDDINRKYNERMAKK